MFITLQQEVRLELVLKKAAMGEIWYCDHTQKLSAIAKFVKNHFIEDCADFTESSLISRAVYEDAVREIVTVFEL
jgi:hypothetical protein